MDHRLDEGSTLEAIRVASPKMVAFAALSLSTLIVFEFMLPKINWVITSIRRESTEKGPYHGFGNGRLIHPSGKKLPPTATLRMK